MSSPSPLGRASLKPITGDAFSWLCSDPVDNENIFDAPSPLQQDLVEKYSHLVGDIFVLKGLSITQGLWKKDRLQAQINGSMIVIQDPVKDLLLGDCDLFVARLFQKVPYGTKKLSIAVTVPKEYQPLWGNKLFQLLVNGLELKPLGFELEQGSDGKGFIPAQSGVYAFELPQDLTELSTISFMTAAGTDFGCTITDMRVIVSAETDPRVQLPVVRVDQSGYVKEYAHIANVALFGSQEIQPINFEIQNTAGNVVYKGVSTFNNYFAESGKTECVLDFSGFNTVGSYQLVVPQQEGIAHVIATPIQIKDSLSAAYSSVRDKALAAFNWFACGDNGPYKVATSAEEEELIFADVVDLATSGDHAQDTVAQLYGSQETIDVSGGWHDAGDYGKYSVNGAYSVGVMLQAYQYAQAGCSYDAGLVSLDNALRPDYLSVNKQELDFLLKMQRADGACYHKVATADWPIINLAPEDDRVQKVVMPISTTATADITASLAAGYTIYKNSNLPEDRKKAAEYIAAAEKAWAFLEKNPDLIMTQALYSGKEYGGPYTDTNDSDERFWAAVELFNATGKETYHVYIKNYLSKIDLLSTLNTDIADWSQVRMLGVFSYLRSVHADLALMKNIEEQLLVYGNKLIEQQSQNPYGLAITGKQQQFDWGSNGIVATYGLHLMYIYKITHDVKYKNAALEMVNYLCGQNPLGYSYITGFGSLSPQHPHFRPSVSGKYAVPTGLLVGGPNNVEHSGDVLGITKENLPPLQQYSDDQEAFSSNEVAINWQATMVALFSLLLEE